MFLQIADKLKRITDEKVEFTILNTNKLNIRPPSIRLPYKKELLYIEQIIEKLKPNILVVANDQGIRTSFIRVCRMHGIPSIAVQDGILANKKLTGFSRLLAWNNYFLWRVISAITTTQTISALFIRLGRQWCVPGWGNGGATVIAAMGEYYKQVFISRGIRPDKILVTGYPLFDDILKYKSGFNKEKTFEKIGLQKGKQPLILLITQPFVEAGLWCSSFRELFIKSVVDGVKHVDGQLVVKLHPREKLSGYKMLAERHFGIKIVVTQDFNLHELLLASDVVITVSSTVGLWVLAYEKPLLVINYFHNDTKNILEDMAITVDEIHELPKTLGSLIEDARLKSTLLHRMRRNLSDHVYLLDGKASERIARLIIATVLDVTKT